MKSLNTTHLLYKVLQVGLLGMLLFGWMLVTTPSAEAANSCAAFQTSRAVSGTLTTLGGSGTCQERCTAYTKTLGTAVNCQSSTIYISDPPIWMCMPDPFGNPICGNWYPGTGTNVETCSAGTGAIINSASNVSAASCAYVPAPTVNLTSNLSTVQNGQTVTLSWTSTGAVSCSGVSSGPTAGTKAQAVNAGARSSVSYSITCLNSAGDSATDSVTISIANPNTPASCTAWNSSSYPTGALVASFPTTGTTACAASCGGYAEANAGTPYSCGLQVITDVFGIGGHNYNGSGGTITTTNICNVMSGATNGALPPTTGTYRFNNAPYSTESAAGLAFNNCIRSSSGSNTSTCAIESYSTSYYGATTCTSAPTGAPDLRAANVRPVSVNAGVPVTLIADISNTGTAPTPSGFTNRFQVSSNSAGTAIVYTGTTADIAIGASATDPSSHSYTFTTSGTFYVQVCADSTNAITTESNEANNCSPWTAVTVTAAPITPTGLTATPQACGTNQLFLDWNDSTGATSYSVYYSNGTFVGNSVGSNYSFNGTAGQSYSFYVRANNSAGVQSGNSSTFNGTAPAACATPPATPTGLTATPQACGTDTITVSWSPVSGATGYDVQYRLSPSGAWTTLTSVASPRTVTGLNPGSTYNFQVRAKNVSGNSAWSAFGTTNAPSDCAPPPPSTPTGLSATPQACGTNQLFLDWNDSTGATSYSVYYSNGTFVGNSVGSNYTFAGTAGQSYSFYVRANNSVGVQSGNSATFSGVVPAACAVPVPPQPSAPATTAGSCGTGAITVSWSPVSGATGYDVQYRLSPTGAWTTLTSVASPRTVTGLNPGSAYNFQVRARNVSGNSAWSAFGTATAPADCAPSIPGTPSGLTATAGSCGTGVINTSWNTVSGATGYDIQINGGAWQNVGNVTSYSHSGLSASSNHTYRVRAWNISGAGTQSSLVSRTAPATCPAPPSQPFAPSATTGTCGTGGISVSWSPVTGATGYDVQYQLSPTGAWTTLTSVTSPRTVTGLNPGSTYNFQVRAKNVSGNSAWSAFGTANAPADCAPSIPGTPTGLSATPQACGTNQLFLDWSDATNATSYSVYYSNGTFVGNSVGSNYTFAGTAGQSYSFYVRANNSVDVQSGNSATFSGVVPAACAVPVPPQPSAPTGLRATAGSCDTGTINLSWNSVSGATSYDLQVNGVWQSVGNATSFNHAGLSANTYQSYRVRARNASGAGTQSGIVSMTSPAACAAVPVDPGLSLAANPARVSNRGSTEITWSMTNPYAMDCSIYGPGMTTATFDPMTATASDNDFSAGPISAKSLYTMSCTDGVTTFTDTATVEVVGEIEEI